MSDFVQDIKHLKLLEIRQFYRLRHLLRFGEGLAECVLYLTTPSSGSASGLAWSLALNRSSSSALQRVHESD